MSQGREEVKVNVQERTIAVPHLGITLRVMLGAAAAATEAPEGSWTLLYRRKKIGTIELKEFTYP